MAVPRAFTDPPLSSPNGKVALVDPLLSKHLCSNHLLLEPEMLRELPGDFGGLRADPESPHTPGCGGCTHPQHLQQKDL